MFSPFVIYSFNLHDNFSKNDNIVSNDQNLSYVIKKNIFFFVDNIELVALLFYCIVMNLLLFIGVFNKLGICVVFFQ